MPYSGGFAVVVLERSAKPFAAMDLADGGRVFGGRDQDNTDTNAAGASITATTGTNWVDPAYDAAGNMDKRPDPSAPGTDASAHLMTYDAWNRLVKITDNAPGTPATIATYEYDGLGRRIEKTVAPGSGDTYDYYHSSSWQVLEVRKNGDTDPYEQFVYDGTYIDAPFMRYVDSNQDGDLDDTDEGAHYFFRDASYNVVAYAGDDGTIKERYRYTPYGERIVMDASFVTKTGGTDYDQQRGFQGLLHDDESGLIENRNRILDPSTGRFLQRDPLGYPDGMNAYAAYHVMWGGVDPSGMETIAEACPGIVADLEGLAADFEGMADAFSDLSNKINVLLNRLDVHMDDIDLWARAMSASRNGGDVWEDFRKLVGWEQYAAGSFWAALKLSGSRVDDVLISPSVRIPGTPGFSQNPMRRMWDRTRHTRNMPALIALGILSRGSAMVADIFNIQYELRNMGDLRLQVVTLRGEVDKVGDWFNGRAEMLRYNIESLESWEMPCETTCQDIRNELRMGQIMSDGQAYLGHGSSALTTGSDLLDEMIQTERDIYNNAIELSR